MDIQGSLVIVDFLAEVDFLDTQDQQVAHKVPLVLVDFLDTQDQQEDHRVLLVLVASRVSQDTQDQQVAHRV